MKNIIRLKNIHLENFKNVNNGTVGFSEYNKKNKLSDILGIYGQNGSGKTAVIESLELLKQVISGRSIDSSKKYLINSKNDSCALSFEFLLKDKHTEKDYKIFYSFEMKISQRIEENFDDEYINAKNSQQSQEIILINKEVLSYSYRNEQNKWANKQIINYNVDNEKQIFTPQYRYKKVAKTTNDKIKLDVAKSLSQENSTSFIFSNKMLTLLREKLQDELAINILNNLRLYIIYNLFVINNRDLSMANSNIIMPFSFRIKDGSKIKSGNIFINLFETSELDEDKYIIISKIIDQINISISAIIPGLEILSKKSRFKGKDGQELIEVRLFSKRGSVEIPLKYESDGIKKIICILSALIAMYNDEKILVAIDELDAGIFEYLLGEILEILGNEAKGQLIFTSHNLRALEKLNKNLVIFTTTNSNNRYIALTNVGKTNNLRDLYYKGILLGGQSEELYDETNKYEISYSLGKAWNE